MDNSHKIEIKKAVFYDLGMTVGDVEPEAQFERNWDQVFLDINGEYLWRHLTQFDTSVATVNLQKHSDLPSGGLLGYPIALFQAQALDVDTTRVQIINAVEYLTWHGRDPTTGALMKRAALFDNKIWWHPIPNGSFNISGLYPWVFNSGNASLFDAIPESFSSAFRVAILAKFVPPGSEKAIALEALYSKYIKRLIVYERAFTDRNIG